MKKAPKTQCFQDFRLAEKEGFEPSRQLSQPTPLAGEPLRPLGYFSKAYKIFIWRRERDSNPRCLATSLVFKTSALNHSAISPCVTSNQYYIRRTRHCQQEISKDTHFNGRPAVNLFALCAAQCYNTPILPQFASAQPFHRGFHVYAEISGSSRRCRPQS